MTNPHTVDTPPPPFINPINELRSLSTALSTFLSNYDDLKNHLNSIKSSIDHLIDTANPNKSTLTSIVSEQNPNGNATSCIRSHDNVRKPEKHNCLKKPEETYSSKKHDEIATSKKFEEIATCEKPEENATSKKPEENANLKKEEIDSSKKPEEIENSEKSDRSKKNEEIFSELKNICKGMSGRKLKQYVSRNISDMNKIREELPKVLKFAKDPAQLVLASIGRFFTQKGRTYVDGSQPFVSRQAVVLILECFVMISSDGIEITEKDKESAAEAAAEWKKRMINEGELSTANEVDARGLLLLISGFGIPNHVFENKDIRDLIKASNVKEISTALRCSIVLIQKIPELMDWMVKCNMEIEAADLAYTLGLEDKCHPQTILMKFFQSKIKDRQHTSLETIKHQLSDLESLSKCLESHNMDPSKLFPEFEINEKIQQLEKKTHEIDLMATQKIKPEPKLQEPKHSRLNTPHKQSSPYPTIENGGMLTGGPIVDRMSNGGPYVRHDDDTALMDRYLGQQFEKKTHEIDLMATQKIKPEPKLQEPKHSRLNTPHKQSSPYPTIENGGMLTGGPIVDRMSNGGPYVRHDDDTALMDRYLGQQFEKKTHEIDLMATQKRKPQPKLQEPKRSRLNMPHQQSSPYPTIENGGMLTGVYGGPVVGRMSNGRPYVRHDDDTALLDRYLGQPYFSQPSLGQPYSSQPLSSGLIGLYGGSSGRALPESFPGLPDPVRRGLVSDLYGFADKVVNAPYGGSQSHAAGSGRTPYFN